MASKGNAFDLGSGSSIFARDPLFATLANGKSRSQVALEAVEASTRKLGRNPGTIAGISRKEQAQRRARSKTSGGG